MNRSGKSFDSPKETQTGDYWEINLLVVLRKLKLVIIEEQTQG